MKHLNSYVYFKKTRIWTNFLISPLHFEGEKIVDHILKIPRLLVLGVKCFNCNTTQICLRYNPTWNRNDIEVVI